MRIPLTTYPTWHLPITLLPIPPPVVCSPLIPSLAIPTLQGDYLAEVFANNKITGSPKTTEIKTEQSTFKYFHKVGCFFISLHNHLLHL